MDCHLGAGSIESIRHHSEESQVLSSNSAGNSGAKAENVSQEPGIPGKE